MGLPGLLFIFQIPFPPFHVIRNINKYNCSIPIFITEVLHCILKIVLENKQQKLYDIARPKNTVRSTKNLNNIVFLVILTGCGT